MIVKTAYWGGVDLWEAIADADKVEIEACENFQKQSSRSRTSVMTAGGVRKLSVPIVHNGGAKIPIQQVRIDYTMPWQREQLRTIVAGYASAPYYDHFIDKIEPIFNLREKFLLDLNVRTLEVVGHILKIDVEPILTSQFCNDISVISPSTIKYWQVFADRHPFAPNLSVLDAIFCLGSLPSAE